MAVFCAITGVVVESVADSGDLTAISFSDFKVSEISAFVSDVPQEAKTNINDIKAVVFMNFFL